MYVYALKTSMAIYNNRVTYNTCLYDIIELVQSKRYASSIIMHYNRMVHEYTDVLVFL